jgi:hypothetical protein
VITRAQALGTWILIVLMLVLAAGQSWGTFLVTDSAGGGSLGISGFSGFPVIGTLIALQTVSILATLLVRPIVIRIVAGLLVPFMIWNFIDVLVSAESKVRETFVRVIAEQTGVMQDASSSEFLVASSNSLFPWVYLGAVTLNIGFLCSIAAVTLKSKAVASAAKDKDLPEDLWGNQK